jgi:hypothetical protein
VLELLDALMFDPAAPASPLHRAFARDLLVLGKV